MTLAEAIEKMQIHKTMLELTDGKRSKKVEALGIILSAAIEKVKGARK